MKSIYSSPLRVYLVLAALALTGVYCGLKLPISLFPNSNKPEIFVGIPYGPLTNHEFLHAHGKRMEQLLAGISTEHVKVDKVVANYGNNDVDYSVEFEWGSPPKTALREVVNVVTTGSTDLPKESRDNRWIGMNRENAGFFAASFFSESRSLDELYDIIEPAFGSKSNLVPDAEKLSVYNPSHKEIRIVPNPERMAALRLFPKHIESALNAFLSSYRGGSLTQGYQKFSIQMPRSTVTIEDLSRIAIHAPTDKTVHLSDLAEIDYAPSTQHTRSFRTNGAPSLILFANPASGANVKRMSENIVSIIEETMPTLPKDIEYRLLVDPSEFIRSAIRNVLHEVFLAAFIAVLVLFFFIGSAKNVLTAAIEIPLSMVLAFILMRLYGMNLNLISLGGLALSAGMNVDASVVVMENIFRHMKQNPGPHSYSQRVDIIVNAVKEVWLPVVAATISSLVVFIPLAFTSELTNAILGDLAKAVVFSHGFSAIVALILVPTIRLQLMNSESTEVKESKLQRAIDRFEQGYANLLKGFLESPRLKRSFYFGLPCLLVLLCLFLLPRLPREIVGKPDTDWVFLSIRTKGNTQNSQMEDQTMRVERTILKEFGDEIKYTFANIGNPNRSHILSRLRDKSKMKVMVKKMGDYFQNSPVTKYWVDSWNPSELKIPTPPDMRLVIRSKDENLRTETARAIYDEFREVDAYKRHRQYPNFSRDKGITLRPIEEQWALLRERGVDLSPADLSDLVRVATTGRSIGEMPIKGENTAVVLRYPPDLFRSAEDIASLPIGVDSKIIPLKALARVELGSIPPTIFREDQQPLIAINGMVGLGNEHKKKESFAKAKKVVEDWKKRNKDQPVTLAFEDPAIELNEALGQLTFAVSVSVGLIFLTLLLQFGSVATTLLILVAIPLGLIGVISALGIFSSTLSLNSALGVILLNGIAVANSILLVDFIRKLVATGLPPRVAAVEASRKRLRPILITSLTSILGMIPIALGMGDGGRILQPLGITVSAGLWVSTTFTLFLVPALQVSYLENQKRWQQRLFSFLALVRKPQTISLLLFFFSSVATANKLTFDEALQQILGRSTDLAQQQSTVKATHARNVPDQLGYFPTLTLTSDYSRQKSFLSTPSTSWSVQGNLRFNIFEFGATQAGINRASAQEKEQEWKLLDTQLDTEGAAVRVLSAYVAAIQKEEINRRGAEVRERALSIARERYKKGRLANEEVDKAAIEHDNAVANYKDAQVASINARADLEELLGHSDVTLGWPWIKRMEELKLTPYSDKDLRMRPDWKSAENAAKASHHQKNESLGGMFPSLDFVGTYGYTDNRSNLLSGNLWSAGVFLTIPLFDKLSSISAYREDAYLAARAEANLEAVRRFAKKEWESVRKQFPIALATAQVREKTARVSKRLYETNLKRFQRGLVSVNDLILDQDRLLQSELLLVSGWQNAHSSFAKVCHTLGKSLRSCP